MLITSRSAAEYRAMFDLADPVTGSILDCCAGGAGFVAETGGAAIALDRVYAQGQAKLAELVRTGQQGASAISYANAEHFDWSWYGTRARREELVRVARGEVRIFPTVVQKTGAAVPFLPALRAEFAARGVPSRLAKVPYLFQVGADEMLVFSVKG